MNRSVLPVMCIIFMQTACDYSAVRDESSEFYAVPVGSVLVLNTELRIAPDQVSVLLQDGVVKQHANINFYQPNCRFELYPISEYARVVNPDRFLITKVYDENEFTSMQKNYYAGLRLLVNDGPETITYATVMHLHSEAQPDVFRMTCKHRDSVVYNRYLTISEMRKTMGDVFTLQIKY